MTKQRVLVVEDDPEISEILSDLLGAEGYDVETAADGAAGLVALRAGRFHLVLTDQRMPGRTGTSMLAEAREQHLLDGTAVLVLTGTPEDPELAGWRVLAKPIDFDHLMDGVHRAMLGRPAPTPGLAGAAVRAEAQAGAPRRPCVELVLYVTCLSSASRRAQRNLERILGRFEPGEVSWSIVDLSVPGTLADPEDRIAFTPTLVKRAPAPRVWMIGDLRDAQPLEHLLADLGVAPRTT